MKKNILVFSVLLFLVSVGYSIPTDVNAYLDKDHTKSSIFFKDGGIVYITAYNGVSCCSNSSLTVYSKNNSINANIIDDDNDGIFSGQFVVGKGITNDSIDYIHADDNNSFVVYVSLSPISNGSLELRAEYEQPSSVVLNATVSKGVFLNWTESYDRSGIEKYFVYRSDKPILENTSLSELVVKSTSKTNLIDRDVLDGRRYYYAVRALDIVENLGNLSNLVYLDTPDLTPPFEVNDLKAVSKSEGRIFLNWLRPYDNTNVSYYLIYRSKTTSFENSTVFANTTQESYYDNNTEDGLTYYYSIKAVDGFNNIGKFSNIVSSTADSSAPKNITDLKFVLGKKGFVNITWTSECSGCLFYVYKSRFSIQFLEDLEGIEPYRSNSFGYIDSVDGIYYYAVIAIDNSGNKGGLSNIIKVDPDLIPPASITELRAIPDNNRVVNITWKASTSSDVSHYNIYRSESKDIYFSEPYATTNKTEILDSRVVNGVEYYYVVRAVDNFDNEDSNTAFVRIVVLDKFVLLNISYPSNNTQVSQDKIAIIGRTDSDAKVKLKTVINDTAFVIDGLVDKNGLFIGYIPLHEGLNNIEITTNDSSGNSKTENLQVSNRFSTVSSSSAEKATEDLKVVIVNNTIVPNNEFLSEVAKNDPNIVKEKDNLQNRITGATVPYDSLTPIILILIIVGLALFIIYKKFFNKNKFSNKLINKTDKK